ncbi:hypothetical protein B5F71_19400 [Bacteroides sp. An269]|nr:hypothetical protein B5F71_19400 [Bacteroides sp. An269]
MRKIAGYLTKNRSEKNQKIAQSTHEKGYIKPRKTFWRNSKQLLKLQRCRRSEDSAPLQFLCRGVCDTLLRVIGCFLTVCCEKEQSP